MAAGRVRRLVNRGHHRSSSFGWGCRAAGAVSLAHSILWDVTGAESSDGMAIVFAGDVITRLPEDEFVLSEEEVREWLEAQGQRPMSSAELVEHLGAIALAEPEELTQSLRGLVDRCWTGRSLVN